MVLHQVACGVLRPGVTAISGPGMVIQPMKLEEEIQELESRGLLKGELVISERAHVLLPIHEMEDAWEDDLRAQKGPHAKLGTTRRGVGPASSDRYARFGLRYSDLVRPGLLRERLELLYASKPYLSNLPGDSINSLARLLKSGSDSLHLSSPPNRASGRRSNVASRSFWKAPRAPSSTSTTGRIRT